MESLQQGDVLRRTPEIEALLAEVHPHYYKSSDYAFFCVLTQSCDLTLRDGQCKSRYITLAAVRPLQLVLERECRARMYTEVEKILGILSEDRRVKIEQFVERLLNNNVDEYFFLKSEQPLPFDCCVFLQLSVAVRAEQHYATLLAAKVLQLTESFQHKIGYLVGNSYSRVGTEDWVPTIESKADFSSRVKGYVNSLNGIEWLEKDVHTRVVAKLKATPNHDLLVALSPAVIAVKAELAKRKEELLDDIQAILVQAGIPIAQAGRARTQLRNSSAVMGRIK